MTRNTLSFLLDTHLLAASEDDFRGFSPRTLGRAHPPCTGELLRNSWFLKIMVCLGVDGVSVARRYHGVTPPFGRHSHTSSEFLPRRPLPRQPWFDGAKCRLRHRSTANTSALSRLFWWLRHSSLLWVQLPVYYARSPFCRTSAATRSLAFAKNARVDWSAVLLGIGGERKSGSVGPVRLV